MLVFVILAALFSVYTWAASSVFFLVTAPSWVIITSIATSLIAIILTGGAGITSRIAIGAFVVSVSSLWSRWLANAMDGLIPMVLALGLATTDAILLTYRIFSIFPMLLLLVLAVRIEHTNPFPFKFGSGLRPGKLGREDIVICYDVKTGKPVIVPGNDRYLNMLIVGPIGSGKSTRLLAPLAWQELQNIKWSMDAGIPRGLTLIEPKGDLTDKVAAMCRELGIPYIHIDPLREGTARFNPLEGDAMTASEATRTVLRSMANKQGKQEPFFAAAQDNAARNIILLLKYTRGDKLSLPDVSIALRDIDSLKRDVDQLKNVVAHEYKVLERLAAQIPGLSGEPQRLMRAEYDRQYATYFNKHNVVIYFEKEVFGKAAEKFFQFVTGLRQQLDELVGNKALFGVISPRVGATGIHDYSSDINLDDHLRTGGVLLVNTASNPLGHVGDAFGCYILQHLQGAVFRRPGDEHTRPRHTTMIDELSGYVGPNYERMLSNGRSYRCENIVALQNTAQLMLPGDRDFRERVMGLCRNKVFFGGMDGADAQYVSREMGATDEVERDYTSRDDGAKSTRESKRTKNRYTPTDLMEMTEYHVVYRTVKANRPQPPGIGTTNLCEFDARPLPSLFSRLHQRWQARHADTATIPPSADDTMPHKYDANVPIAQPEPPARPVPIYGEQAVLFEPSPVAPATPMTPIEPYTPPKKKRPKQTAIATAPVTIFTGNTERSDVSDDSF